MDYLLQLTHFPSKPLYFLYLNRDDTSFCKTVHISALLWRLTNLRVSSPCHPSYPRTLFVPHISSFFPSYFLSPEAKMFYINGSESKNGENLSRKEEKKSWNQSGKEKAKKGENVSCFPINCGAFSLVFTHEVSASPQHRVSHKKRRLWGKHQLKRYSVKVLVIQSCLTLCNPMV